MKETTKEGSVFYTNGGTYNIHIKIVLENGKIGKGERLLTFQFYLYSKNIFLRPFWHHKENQIVE